MPETDTSSDVGENVGEKADVKSLILAKVPAGRELGGGARLLPDYW
jgi:hypothetical protein